MGDGKSSRISLGVKAMDKENWWSEVLKKNRERFYQLEAQRSAVENRLRDINAEIDKVLASAEEANRELEKLLEGTTKEKK